MFHASSVGLRYSLVFICFSFPISIELDTKRNSYIWGVSIGRGSWVVGPKSWVVGSKSWVVGRGLLIGRDLH